MLKHFQERMPYCSCRTSREEPLAPGCVSQAESSLRIVTSKRQKGLPRPRLWEAWRGSRFGDHRPRRLRRLSGSAQCGDVE